MKQFFHQCFHLKTIVFISCALSLSVFAKGQTTTAETPPKAIASDDDDMESDTAVTTDKAVTAKNGDNKFIVAADFGGATIYSSSNGNVTTAPGLAWSASVQYAYQFKLKSKATRLFLSAGLELRNLNGTLSAADGVGSTEYDNYHYWYAGIPVTFQVVHVKHKIGSKNDVGFYAQSGMTIGFKIDMLDVNSIQGNNSWENANDSYTAFMLYDYLSFGVAVKTKNDTYLIGPYAGAVLTNISAVDGITQNVLSYGMRLSVLLFK